MFLADDFQPHLDGWSVDELEAMESTVLGLRPDLTVGFRNTAWDRFACANGGEEVLRWNGRRVTEIFAPALRGYYEQLFRRVAAREVPEDHDYECSSPEQFRRFRLRVTPLPRGGLLLVHHLVETRTHDELGRRAREPSEPVYRGENGMITQCCHCRMVRRADDPDTWDWVPAWVATPPDDVTHGLCRVCFRHYFPKAARSWDARARRADLDA